MRDFINGISFETSEVIMVSLNYFVKVCSQELIKPTAGTKN